MARPYLFSGFVLAIAFFASCSGTYIVTAPREWVRESTTQVCIFVSDPRSPAGSLTFAVNYTRTFYKQDPVVKVLLQPTTIIIPAGKIEFCEDISVPTTEYYYGQLNVLGTIGGARVNHTARVNLVRNLRKTIMQTDKYLYKPGQTVQLRMITLAGANLSVATNQYPEVWVTSPSGTRIAQWLDVDNSAGLVHLNMVLADEPEQGRYTIRAKRWDNETNQVQFKVEEYVLPRFQVTLKPPKTILATDHQFSVTVCAKYTFGENVNGNLTLEVDNKRSRHCRVAYNITKQLAGCQDVLVELSSVRVIDCDARSIMLVARVTEEGTGVNLLETSHVSVSRKPITFKLVYKDKYIKPNLPYSLKVRAELPDGSPAGHAKVEVCTGDHCQNITTPSNGLITPYISSYNTNKVIMKALTTRAALYESSYSTTIQRYYSPSNSSLLIYAPEEELKCSEGFSGLDHILPIFFSASGQTSAIINVQIMSRRSIQFSLTEEYELLESDLPIRGGSDVLLEPLQPPYPGTTRGVINIPVRIPHTASPTARVIVWMVRSDGEVVSDTREVKVERCLPNVAELSWSQSKVQPGEETQLALQAAPSSLCSIGVVDKSVELLNTQGDPFSLEALFSPLRNFKVSPWSGAQVNDYEYCRHQYAANDEDTNDYYTNYVDALKMFDESGLFIFSDLRVETRPCEKEEYRNYYSTRFGSISTSVHDEGLINVRTSYKGQNRITSGTPNLSSAPELASTPELASQEEPRTDFPETWLWDLKIMPESGEVSQTLTLPDTITQWVGKAVCVHPQEGIALTQKVNITTFTPFFLDLALPPSVKRGETLNVKISVFNYLDRPIPVIISVLESPAYEIVNGPEGGSVQRSCVGGSSKAVVGVRIKPTELGQVNITVEGMVDHEYAEACGTRDLTINRRDSLIKPITVEAEGFPREKTLTKYICARDLVDGSDALGTWEVAAPSAIVEGSDRGWISVVGDLLALTLENLGGLIRMPSGCGEQNMVNFAPNIYILQYLRATGQEAPDATTKLLSFMRTGYQRQLLYRRSNGSFSAFGAADDSGSTWLTAFVLKSFTQAQDYISIDNQSLNKTRNWLQKTQDENGCFRTLGKVFSKGLKGGLRGSNSAVPLTAYVLVSLLEGGEEPLRHVVSNAVSCITSHTSYDPYTMALQAYALALAQVTEAEAVLQRLLGVAVVAKNSTHWELPRGPGRSNSLAVETAGYAILAMMALDPITYDQQARKVVKWITAQRNGRGGFYSTQDTVVALQAMASYEAQQYQGDLNMVATVKTSRLEHSFALDETNKLLTQMVPLVALPTSVSLTMVGQGCAVFQSVLRYNVHDPEPSDAFTLNLGAKTEPDKTCVTKRIKACVTYLLTDGQSNMAVMEVNLISGYIPNKEDLKEIVRANNVIKRYEVDGSKVSFYVDELVTGEELCVSLQALREVDVENPKPGSVVVYDYYQPEFSISKTYRFPPAEECRYAF